MALLRTTRPAGAAPRGAPSGALLRAGSVLVVMLALLPAGSVRAERAGPTEYEIKAAFLFNFVSFVEWPREAIQNDTLVVGVLGKDPFGSALERVLAGERHEGKALVVRRCATVEDALSVHVLFLNVPDAEMASRLAQLGSRPILTVGQSRDFARRGGMIQFKTVDGRVRFEVNQAAASRAGLRLSSHLLKLALRVHGDDDR